MCLWYLTSSNWDDDYWCSVTSLLATCQTNWFLMDELNIFCCIQYTSYSVYVGTFDSKSWNNNNKHNVKNAGKCNHCKPLTRTSTMEPTAQGSMPVYEMADTSGMARMWNGQPFTASPSLNTMIWNYNLKFHTQYKLRRVFGVPSTNNF